MTTIEALTDENRRLKKALRLIHGELEHKHGGPEFSDCVSVPHLYTLASEALGIPIEPRCQKCKEYREQQLAEAIELQGEIDDE